MNAVAGADLMLKERWRKSADVAVKAEIDPDFFARSPEKTKAAVNTLVSVPNGTLKPMTAPL